MGKRHLWRKQPYARLQKNDSGCMWAVFRILNYQRWANVKKMLPYYGKKHKPHRQPTKPEEQPDDQYQIGHTDELQNYDAIMLNSDSMNSSSKDLSTSIEEDDIAKETDLDIQQPRLRTSEDHHTELSTPALLSLLKASDLNLDSPRKIKLARSGTYPSPNKRSLDFGRTPSKVENKHIEIWPAVSNNIEPELRRAKSYTMMRRSSSLHESEGKDGLLFDVKSRKEFKKFPSYSEKDFASFGNRYLHRRTFSEKLSFLETESYSFASNDATRLSFDVYTMVGSKLDSPRELGSTRERENLPDSQVNENEDSFVDKQGQKNHEENEDQIEFIAEIPLAEDEVAILESKITLINGENTECSIEDDNVEEYNEQFEYVKHILDVLGFLEAEDRYTIWESAEETLDPNLFDEIEVLCPFEPNPSTKDGEELSMSISDRRVIFHLIIEALVDIHEKTFAYCDPNSLSFALQTGAILKGKRRIMEEVWKFVKKFLEWRPEFGLRVDPAMAHELSKNGSDWGNGQNEIEFVGLDLEELIFDDLLDEILGC